MNFSERIIFQSSKDSINFSERIIFQSEDSMNYSERIILQSDKERTIISSNSKNLPQSTLLYFPTRKRMLVCQVPEHS